ncbi:MAG: hemerythrin domain-containing protein [Zoogloea sp.]|nr:hemerythrin domain-containing protein [Zoogloea sp.]
MTEHILSFEWSDRYLLGYAAMDETHREFVDLVDALLSGDDADLMLALDAFAHHAVDHFAQEAEWMKSDGFPALDCHVAEHDKVLASISQVQEMLAQGNVEVVRQLAIALMEWFPAHADYMDSALATWMVKHSHKAVPLVFRRQKPAV